MFVQGGYQSSLQTHMGTHGNMHSVFAVMSWRRRGFFATYCHRWQNICTTVNLQVLYLDSGGLQEHRPSGSLLILSLWCNVGEWPECTCNAGHYSVVLDEVWWRPVKSAGAPSLWVYRWATVWYQGMEANSFGFVPLLARCYYGTQFRNWSLFFSPTQHTVQISPHLITIFSDGSKAHYVDAYLLTNAWRSWGIMLKITVYSFLCTFCRIQKINSLYFFNSPHIYQNCRKFRKCVNVPL